MKFDQYQEKLKVIEKLIQQANTGSPRELAKQLLISERTVRRLIERLKVKNKSIRFCRKSQSYLIKE